ncbi:MAG: pilus assembly protein TadG-related protein [Bdellovibrionales bacterium]
MKIINNIKKYIKDTAGATAMVFAIAVPIVIGATGLSTDLAFAYLIKQRLSHALDAAAVAAAASANDGSDVQAKIDQFFEQNYPEEKLGATSDIQVTLDGSDIIVSATAQYDTFFVKFLGVDDIEIYAESTVAREIIGLEVAMVLDVTGSMSTVVDGVSNINALKTAADNFVDILFNSAIFDDTIKIGVVPYSTAVNVGPYGLGFDPDGDAYGDAFVANPDDLDFNQSQKWQWHGCVLALDHTEDTEDSDSSTEWEMYRHTFQYSQDNFFRSWSNDYHDWWYNVYDNYYGPNYSCNKSYILPMTSNEQDILDHIDTFYASGSTLGNLGMAWGYRVISPNEPFTEGASYDDDEWQKAVVMMTDGDNYMNPYYSAYGGYTQHSVDVDELNDRLEETCTNMKNDGIKIYTITFSYQVGTSNGQPVYNIDDDTKEVYERCATDENKYYDALGQEELIDVFETISRELSLIHIKG